MTFDPTDNLIPSLDGPAGLTFRCPLRAKSPPPSAPAPDARAFVAAADSPPVERAKTNPDAVGALQRCGQRGSLLPSAHWRRRFCSSRCRVAAHRARRPTPVVYPAERGR